MKFILKQEGGFKSELPYGELHVSGDETKGFRPFQLLVASVAVCSGGVLQKVLEKKRLEIEDLSVKTEVKRNPDEANRVTDLHMHFVIKGQDLKNEVVEKSMELARKNCPMYQSVKDSIKITESYEIVS
ncbi:OsmC family protein [Bacillus carboniphilus]|uniref:OsmC family protein n=1 Tax=Bacillus carboniphilus TaxID=86663 RepID=A0ABN0WMU1_9BACI